VGSRRVKAVAGTHSRREKGGGMRAANRAGWATPMQKFAFLNLSARAFAILIRSVEGGAVTRGDVAGLFTVYKRSKRSAALLERLIRNGYLVPVDGRFEPTSKARLAVDVFLRVATPGSPSFGGLRRLKREATIMVCGEELAGAASVAGWRKPRTPGLAAPSSDSGGAAGGSRTPEWSGGRR